MTNPDRAFHARRTQNWLWLAFLYGSYYALRYNLSLANAPIRAEFGFSKAEFGLVLSGTYIAYAVGQFVNGPIVDRFGGKRMMLVGAAGTILANVLFGLNALTGQLNLFVAVWVLNGYVQAFGSPGNHKVNCHWFAVGERGLFAGVFSAVVYLGRAAMMLVGPFILSFFHWKWLFFAPAAVAALVAVAMWRQVAETPRETGHDVSFADSKVAAGTHVSFFTSLRLVMGNRTMWIFGLAYLSTGVVRNGLEQWFPSYLQEVHGIAPGSVEFGAQAILMPLAALAGAISAGWVSDHLFQARRGPVVAIMYFLQAAVLVGFVYASDPHVCGTLLIVLSFLFSGPHSIVGTAVTMDYGGKEATGAATGFIDGMQYLGATLVGVGMGHLIDLLGWTAWGPSLILFAVAGGALTCLVWNAGGRGGAADPGDLAPDRQAA
jgi:OPA family glycerol-3-phosphate transporter-like MFS transporter